MEILLILVMGWAVVGVLVNLYEVGWSLVYLARHPVDLLLAISAMAGGVLVCRYLGWI